MKTAIIILAIIGLAVAFLAAIFKVQDRSDDQSEETWNQLRAERDIYSPNDYAGRGLSTNQSVKRARGGRQ